MIDNQKMESNKENAKIVFIDRKKNSYLKDKLNNLVENFFLRNIEKQYFDDNLVFKVLYDKIYRPEIYKFLINSDKEKVNLNVIKNILKMNESKMEFSFKRIKDFGNDISIMNLENFDDEILSENNQLVFLHKTFIKEKLARYSSFFLCVMSAFFKFAVRKDHISNLTLVFIAFNLGYIFYLNKRKQDVFESVLYKFILQKNKNEIQVYKKFYI